ncbi:glycosyltransferase [Alkalihalobacillus oceani]|uniref:glycosyltransferase family protein n=1 Tax=Halalkalibacter oceani TaxID=1653776 RepID=UPI00203D26AD|nr:glycosyltransferase [Halalkalibacter oceani]MCM3761349.1 glycosyltransferase [Halalkalibacter oceani]
MSEARKVKILVLINKIWVYIKHQPKMDMIRALEKYADVEYWHESGDIREILAGLDHRPDFIFHYDIAWRYGLAPKITGLGQVDIPKGCYVIDVDWKPEERRKYFDENKVDMIFSATKHPFLQLFPQYSERLCWWPWAINPAVMKDWKEKKDIDTLLMGLVYIEDKSRLPADKSPKAMPVKGRYAFRDAVLERMRTEPGFVYQPHPGHRVIASAKNEEVLVNERYARELNRAKIFYTCGSRINAGGIAVLKFFEALACKTLLLAETNLEIAELGFADQVHYVACTVDTFYEQTQYYLKNEAERQRISQAGYEFIHRHHTIDQRAIQMIEAIKEKCQIRL